MAENVDRIFVMANPRGRQETPQGVFTPLSPGQVALIEEHPDHPYDAAAGVNRVFIVQGDPPCEAALTTTVSEKLVQNQLVQMSRSDAYAIYKQKTGNDYPGTEEAPEGPEPFTFEESQSVDTRTPAQKRADTIAAKKAAEGHPTEDEAASENASQSADSDESDEED